eukprot:958466_1
MANDSDIADTDSDNDVFDLDDVGTKKKRYDAETPSDARDDFDFDAPSKPKAKKRVIADSDDSDEDSAPKFVNTIIHQHSSTASDTDTIQTHTTQYIHIYMDCTNHTHYTI